MVIRMIRLVKFRSNNLELIKIIGKFKGVTTEN